MAAKDDLVVEVGVHPNEPTMSGAFLRSKNRNKGIVANITIDAPAQHTLYAGDLFTTRQRWPQHYEVRVPPGGTVLIGFSKAEIWLSVDNNDPNDSTRIRRQVVQQSFSVAGAYYLDPPWPEKNERPKDFLWFYSIPLVHSYWNEMQLAVSLHPNRTLDCVIWDSVNKDSFGFSVTPGFHQVVHVSTQRPSFRIDKCDFLGPAATAKGVEQIDALDSRIVSD